MNTSNYKSFLATLLFLAIGLPACKQAPTSVPTPITVQLNFTHGVQFGGFYAADQKGYYAAEGLTVTFSQGGPTIIDQVTPVASGTAQFGFVSADDLLLAHAEGKPLRAIATIYRRSPVVFIARADSGITRPLDFAGKKIRVTANVAPTLRAMMARVGIPPNRYTEVVAPSNLRLFASGQIPVWGVYINAFLFEAQQAGYKLNIVYPDDYGVHFYSNTIFARDDFVSAKPDVAKRFLRATLKGWTYAVENPAAVGPIVLKYKPDADAALETAKMTASLPLINTGEDYIGWMKPEIWAGMEKTLREQGVLKKPVDLKQVYTLQFLKEIYQK